ncbi:MAG TPA: NUDIX domain-containing protein, partial [Chloroflexia bacterium]|nr:NUDIX domain-containing protein [Chloroflexia bacterium]
MSLELDRVEKAEPSEGYMTEAAISGALLQVPKIRVIAIGIFMQDNRILVMEGYDPLKKQLFYRPLGGGIEFGERAQDALRREMLEEAEAEITGLGYMGTVENIFTYNGDMGHEIVLVYRARFTNP